MDPETQDLDVKPPEVDSSTTETDVKPPENAAPSTAPEVVKPPTKEEAIAAVLDPLKKAESTDAKKEEDSSKPKEEAQEEVEPEKQVEKAVPYERFREVNEKLKQVEEPAGRMAAIEGYCQKHNISAEDFQVTLDLAAAIKNDPKRAKELLMPVLEQLNVLTGEGLPADLAKDVEEGLVSPERAKEIAQLRLKERSFEQRTKSAEQQRVQQAQQQLSRSLNSWDTSMRAKHPEFKPKADEKADDGVYEIFQDRFTSAWQRTPPQSIEDAVALAEKTLTGTLALVKRFQPTPPPKKVLRSNGASSTATSTIDSSKPGWTKQVAQEVLARYN